MGWMCETVYCSVFQHHWVNRGFLNGPVCPIYGFGAMFVIWFLLPVQDSWLLVFLLGMIMTSALEYLTSVLMEKLFHAKWWDYSKHRFNINGRVCLLNSTLFGLLSLVLMEWIHPFVRHYIALIPPLTAIVLAWVFVVVFTIDSAATVYTMMSLNGKLKQLRVLAEELKYSSEAKKWYYEHKIHETLEALHNQLEEEKTELAERTRDRLNVLLTRRFGHQRLLDAFPTMQHICYKEQLEALRTEWKQQHQDLKKRIHKEK